MATESKYERLRREIEAYGAAAFENLLRCQGIGTAITEGLPGYLGCSEESVSSVPPEGPFDPRREYGDAAYSYHEREVIVLEPVRFGVSLVVSNAEDSGALWLRTVISIEVTGKTFDIFVGSQPLIRTPLDYNGKLEPIHKAIFREFLQTFQQEVMEFNNARFKTGIGFLPV